MSERLFFFGRQRDVAATNKVTRLYAYEVRLLLAPFRRARSRVALIDCFGGFLNRYYVALFIYVHYTLFVSLFLSDNLYVHVYIFGA